MIRRWATRASFVLTGLLPAAVEAQSFSRAAIQTIYRDGVPHTSSTGQLLTGYDPDRSFFSIGMWGTPTHGTSGGYFYDWQDLKSAGYNTAWTFFNNSPTNALQSGNINGMQVVLMGEQTNEQLAIIRDNPRLRDRLLGVMWIDEPTTTVPMNQMQARFDSFQAYRQRLAGYLPDTPAFVNESPAYNNGTTQRNWWLKWATHADLSSQDNYPVQAVTTTIAPIADSVSLAVSNYGQQKPVWAVIGAFHTDVPDNSDFPFRFPTPQQLRAQVYTALIHGATGITYFAWDSYILRMGHNLGMSPNPQPNGYSSEHPQRAHNDPVLLAKSKATWDAAAAVNAELEALKSTILSNTVSPDELSYTIQISNLSKPNDSRWYSNTPVRTLLKQQPNGDYVLLAVNLDDRAMDVHFSFSELFSDIGLMFEIEPAYFNQLGQADQFSYRFMPFATHVFVLAVPEPAGACTLLMLIGTFMMSRATQRKGFTV